MPIDPDDLARPGVLLYPFRYREARTGKWLRARYVATREDIAARYAAWAIDGPAEVRNLSGEHTSGFMAHARISPSSAPKCEANTDMQPGAESLHEVETFLLCVFLRRYATWCLRTRRYAQAQGAGRLAREIGTAMRATT
jgi:hypothetical protein